MQNVTFKCDSCGVKLEVCPEYNQLSAAEREEATTFRFFRLQVIPKVVVEMHRTPGGGETLPSHDTTGVGESRHLDVCRRCAESLPLLKLLKP